MRKLLILAIGLLTLTMPSMADNDKKISFEQLPQKSQDFIKTNFKNWDIAQVMMETDMLTKNYDVIFTNGNMIEFGKNGEWTELQFKNTEVPAKMVPKAIASYVDKNYKMKKIVSIERDTNDYEIKLNDGLEITFNKKFEVIDIDR